MIFKYLFYKTINNDRLTDGKIEVLLKLIMKYGDRPFKNFSSTSVAFKGIGLLNSYSDSSTKRK